MKSHWAASLIGRRWTPDEDCWWLIRRFLWLRHGLELPPIAGSDFAEADYVAAIRALGWLAASEPREDDIVILRSPAWRRHAGVMVATSKGLLLLLHSDGFMTVRGPVGSVVAQPLRALLDAGFHEPELWRKPEVA